MALNGAVFLDKDGTLLRDVPYNVDPARMMLARAADRGLRRLARIGMPLFVVTNQAGVALGRFDEDALLAVHARMKALFAECGAVLAGFYYCPHHPRGAHARYALACSCRKPLPGMLEAAAQRHALSLPASWMIGDILDDVEAGNRAGCRTILIDNGNETEWRTSPWRMPAYRAADLDEAAGIVAAFEAGRWHPPERAA